MIPLAGIPWRLIGIATAAIAAGMLLWRVTAWRAGYLERDQVVSEFAAYRGAVAERDELAAKDRADAAARSELLSLSVETARAKIEELRSHPIVSAVYRDKIVNGHTCPDPRIGPEWIGVYNDTADAATAAVSAPD